MDNVTAFPLIFFSFERAVHRLGCFDRKRVEAIRFINTGLQIVL